jgi:hypothetical protein
MSTTEGEPMKEVVRSVLGEDRNRLDSWKEIAVYLGREVRTAQRWEKCEGLPVKRHAHPKASSVYAFKLEIDAWLKSRDWAANELVPNTDRSERAAESLHPSPLAAVRIPAKSRLPLENGAAGVGSLDLLQGENRIRLYFYVQLRGERDTTRSSLKKSLARGRGVD